MVPQKHIRFIAANRELREFLRRAEALANRAGASGKSELEPICSRLMNLQTEVGDSSRSETLDESSLGEIAEYVQNLAALQRAVEKARTRWIVRRLQLDSGKKRLAILPN